MSAVSAFLLVGLVNLVSSTDPCIQDCRDVPVKYDFDTSAYFNGTWYVTHSLPPEHGVCMSILPQLSRRLVHELYVFKRNGVTEYAEGYIYLGPFSKGYSEFISETRPVRRSPVPNPDFIPMSVKVIATDYTNYAFLYDCIKIYGGPSVYLILSRRPDPDSVNPDVDKELRRLQMKLSEFGSTKGLNCPKIDRSDIYVERKLKIKGVYEGHEY